MTRQYKAMRGMYAAVLHEIFSFSSLENEAQACDGILHGRKRNCRDPFSLEK